jgi:hypothetical protein
VTENNSKQLSNPFSTGGGGTHFEAHIQASFVVLMLTGGYAPCLPCWPIVEVKLQGKIDGFDTDDVIVFVEDRNTQERRKLIGQVKHSIGITKGDNIFAEVVQAAWNDFNNSNVFTKEKDIIALITGSLSKTDSDNVRWLLNQARHTKDVDEFYRNVEKSNFSPAKSGEKLEAICHHLKTANNGVGISKEDIYSFLNHFHLVGYDLGDGSGIVLSLLHSHISQFNKEVPECLWARVVDTVQTWNQDAGTIVLEKLPEDLRNAFKQPTLVHIPKELIPQAELVRTDWKQHKYATNLALASLIGAWYENNEADTSVLGELTTENYSTWVIKAREILHLPDHPLSMKNQMWEIVERGNLWEMLGSRIFDQNLDTFKDLAVKVLTERNPAFDLTSEDRLMAAFYGKTFTYSSVLRKGIAEGLAILGSRPQPLKNCSLGKAENIAVMSVREIFVDADWKLWASLNDLSPLLAEAAPKEFLDSIDKALSLSPCSLDEVFAQEGSGIMGKNYLNGLLSALEGIAWEEEHLVHVCVILGELSNRDPGGNYANRPANSLVQILLPWYPQTFASVEKQRVAVKTLSRECPSVAWKLLISLLPRQHRTSTGSYRQVWRNPVPEDWNKSINQQEYWSQVSFYAELLVEQAGQDATKLGDLVKHFDSLSKPAFDQLFKVLSSDAILSLPDDKRLPLWNSLKSSISKHRRFPDAEWVIKDESLLSSLDTIATQLAPSDPFYVHQSLFSNGNNFDFYGENESWQEREKKLDQLREEAIREILKFDDIKLVLEFAQQNVNSDLVGYSFGKIADEEIDRVLLPAYLEPENHKLLSFASRYIYGRLQVNGWPWVDELNKSEWTQKQISQFLACLPFNNETWKRVEVLLGDKEKDYWQKANVRFSDEALFVINKLVDYERPMAAIELLGLMEFKKQSIDTSVCVKTLIAAASSSEPSYVISNSHHHATKLIKTLQETLEIDSNDLFQVEWAYLAWLNPIHGNAPKSLEYRLASSPEIFCEGIRLIYKSERTEDASASSSEEVKAVASDVYQLLMNWRTPPGTEKDGSFDDTHFSEWLQSVKEISKESGHLKIALVHVGQILIYCPPDPSGLWINDTVASALNAKDAEEMRSGFKTGMLNSRGFYRVDPTGKPERELAEQYKQKAEAAENSGYHRLAETLKEISASYVREAGSCQDRFQKMSSSS